MKIFLRMDHGDDTRKKPNEYTKCHQTEYLKIVSPRELKTYSHSKNYKADV